MSELGKEIPLKPANERFTDTQWQAIFDGGDNLLVSASAGSGKTTVLVRRVIEALNRGQEIDRLLIVTFTEAAANEMKERIHEALQKAINHETDEIRRQHFLQQLIKLPSAQISTLHSFCLAVIRKYYYLIDLDPNFRLLSDETEQALLMEEVWQNLIEEKYASEDQQFYLLAEAFANDRSDEGLTQLIMGLYRFSRANAKPNQWLNELVNSYDTTLTLAEQPIFKAYLQPMLLDVLNEIKNYLTLAQSIVQPTALTKVQQCLVDDQAQIAAIINALDQKQVEQAYQLIDSLSFKRYPVVRSDNEDSAFSIQAKLYRESAKETSKLLKDLWPYDPNQTLTLLTQSQPIVCEAAKLTQAFIQAFNQAKLSKSVLDFNDLEHYALEILAGNNEGSIASQYYRQTFDEVLVDEYQDVNRLQEAIIYWVSQEDQPGNMFMVGDVKQSIYAFRQADPTLFIEKYLKFGQNEDGRRIILAENFRSRKEVLDFTNFIFEQLMDEKVGQIAYDEAAKLKFGFPNFPESDQFDTELLLYLNEKAAEREELEWNIDTKAQGELMIVAKKIRELIDSDYQIYDKKLQTNRSVTYRDFVILTPTRNNHLTLIDLFAQLKIPVELADAQNYFQATEVQQILALLQIIDNPLQDIPLVAVLRSPIVGLNEQDLAQIRLVAKTEYFYEALIAALDHSFTFSQKIQRFIQQLKNWRKLARTDSIEKLLWTIYDETGFLDYVGGMASGRQRQTNLLAFITRAQAYEQSSFKGVYQFVRFIQKMQEKSNDLAKPVSEMHEDAVRVMTIHASKGLEFPIVFVVDLAKRFNYSDLNERYILDEHLGAGIKYRDDHYVQYDTLPYLAIKQIKLKKMLSEEMRKLYVALTRAEQKLFLVGTYASQEQAIKEWQKALAQDEIILSSNLRLSRSGNFLNWLGYCLIRHPQCAQYFDESYERHKTIDSPARFKIAWFTENDLVPIMEQQSSSKPAEIEQIFDVKNENQTVAQLKERLKYQYPYIRSTKTANYQSVSELKRMYEDPDEQHLNKLVWQDRWQQEQRQAWRFVNDELAKPKFSQMSDKKLLTGAQIGIATHKLLQLLPLNQEINESFLKDFSQHLMEQGIFTPEMVTQLRFQSILWFLTTPLGQRLIKHGYHKREVPFAMLKQANQIFEEFDEEESAILIHGVIDGYFIEEDGIVLFDFKTDYFAEKDKVEQLAKTRYYGQLQLYAQALSESYEMPVKEKYLVLLNHQQIIACS